MLIIIIDIILTNLIENGSAIEYPRCETVLVGYSSRSHGKFLTIHLISMSFVLFITLLIEMGFHFNPGSTTIHFSSLDSLQHNDRNFGKTMKYSNCIKIYAWVKKSNEIAGLMYIMNELRKVASKHLVVNIQTPLNRTIIQNIITNYEVNILEKNRGFTY